MGFTSSNDERFLPAIKFIGLLDNQGVPTERWKAARGNLGAAIAQGMQEGYADLFSQYPDAYNKDDEALRTYFNVNSGLGASAVGSMVNTFKALCTLANFDEDSLEELGESSERNVNISSNRSTQPASSNTAASATTVNVNIQLQLPSDTTGEVYDKFFSAMKKYLG